MLIKSFIFFLNMLTILFCLSSNTLAKEIQLNYGKMTLNANLSLAKNKDLTQGVIVLVHGTLAHNQMDTIKNLTEVLNERELNTLAINLSLGVNNRHGMYDCNLVHRHKHLDALNEINVWLNWLKSKNARDLILLGHSRGGNQVARFVAERSKHQLKKLILMAPSTWSELDAAKNFEKQHGYPLKKALLKAKNATQRGQENKIMQKAGLLYCPNADVTAQSFLSYYAPDIRFDTPSILGELSIPTLIVAGGKDKIVKNLISRVRSLAISNQLVLRVIDDADHFFLDLFAEDVADLIETFLSSGG